MMYDWDGNGWGVGTWLAMAVFMLISWGGLVVVVVLLLRRSRPVEGPPGQRSPHHDAERILDERFARGEIDEQEFTARRTTLRRPD
ncbi:SHOCT domain-containing protein [Arthrobacter pityocampae]|uniref:SHOCT domain-containing protein n=1 Tax=Arthrobacter pityocampae TaxID=547334 RepID=UPI003736E36D